MWCVGSAAGGFSCLLHEIMISAIEKDNPTAAQSALKHGLNPKNRLNTVVKYDWFSYIHIAAIIGSLKVMKILAAVVEIDLKSSEGSTALEYSLMHNNTSIVQFLLEKGADVNAHSNSHGFSPLHTACLFQLRPKKQNNVTSILRAKSHYKMIYDINPENVKMLLDNGANVHYTDNFSNTALVAAIVSKRNISANASSYEAVISLLTEAMQFKITGPFKTIDSPITCPICLSDDDHGDFCHLECCQHSYHVQCLRKWYKMETSNRKCPTCRSALLTARPVKKKIKKLKN